MANERFKFDLAEFRSQLKYRTVELDNGATLSAEADRWQKIFKQTPADGSAGEVLISTRGKVVSEKLRKSV